MEVREAPAAVFSRGLALMGVAIVRVVAVVDVAITVMSGEPLTFGTLLYVVFFLTSLWQFGSDTPDARWIIGPVGLGVAAFIVGVDGGWLSEPLEAVTGLASLVAGGVLASALVRHFERFLAWYSVALGALAFLANPRARMQSACSFGSPC